MESKVKINNTTTAIIQVNLGQPAPPVKNWRILLVESFTARMPAHLEYLLTFKHTYTHTRLTALFPELPR